MLPAKESGPQSKDWGRVSKFLRRVGTYSPESCCRRATIASEVAEIGVHRQFGLAQLSPDCVNVELDLGRLSSWEASAERSKAAFGDQRRYKAAEQHEADASGKAGCDHAQRRGRGFSGGVVIMGRTPGPGLLSNQHARRNHRECGGAKIPFKSVTGNSGPPLNWAPELRSDAPYPRFMTNPA